MARKKTSISNLKNGTLHLSIHSEGDGALLLSLWDTEEQARLGGIYAPLKLSGEQVNKLKTLGESIRPPTEEELQFLKVGDRVRAKIRVWDLPGNADPGPIRAEPGEEGVCVHAEPGNWPTVMFDNGATCVTTDEVEKIES